MANINRLIQLSQITKAAGQPQVTLQHALILTANIGAVFGPELSRAYASAAGALDLDWPANTPARVHGDELFGQGGLSLVPDSTRVGKLTVGPVLTYVINLVSTPNVNGTLYAMQVNGNPISFTSAGVNDDVFTNFKTQIDALAIAGLTTSVTGGAGTKVLTLSWDLTHWGTFNLATAAGLDYGPLGLDLLECKATTVDPATSMATQLDNIRKTTDDFYFVLNPYPGLAINQVIATWCAANGKELIQADPSSDIIQHVLSGATDIAAVWAAASMQNAAAIYHGQPGEAADAAWVGGSSPTVPGTEDWFGRTLAGVQTDNLTETQLNNSVGNLITALVAKNCSVYVAMGPFKVVLGGNAGDGTPIDLVRFAQAFAQNLKTAEAAVIAGAAPLKVPGNALGIQMMYGAMLAVFALNTGPTKAINTYTLQPTATIANRIATGFAYTIKYNGSIRGVIETGVITQ